MAGDCLPAVRIKAGEKAGTLRKLLPQLIGCLTSAAIPLSTHDIDDTFDALRPYLLAYEQQSGVTFPERVDEKRRRI